MQTAPLPRQLFNRRDFMRTAAVIGGAGLAVRSGAAEVNPATLRRDASLLAPLPNPAAPSSALSPEPLAPPDRQPNELKLPAPPRRKLGWAVVGLGELALGEVLPAFKECERSRLVALVSGHPEKARQVALSYGVEPEGIYSYEKFERLAENPAVDVIYIVLPNSLHAEYTVRGLKAGKHVLCEKPMAASIAECEQMISTSQQAKRQLGVAYRLHHEPMTLAVLDLCQRKTFGEIKTFTSSNCQDVKAPNIRLAASTAGGPVSDVGVYSINMIRTCLGEDPVEAFATAHWGKADARFREVPESVAYTLKFPSGVLASCDCSFGTARSSRFRILGTKGFVEMDPAFPYQGQRLRRSEQAVEGSDSMLVDMQIKAVNQFAKQFDHFSASALGEMKLKTPGEMGLADLRVVLAIQQSIRSGRPVTIQPT